MDIQPEESALSGYSTCGVCTKWIFNLSSALNGYSTCGVCTPITVSHVTVQRMSVATQPARPVPVLPCVNTKQRSLVAIVPRNHTQPMESKLKEACSAHPTDGCYAH